jgi:hypothetical protein
MEREERLHADSGVDLAMVVDGQLFIAQAKMQDSKSRLRGTQHLSPKRLAITLAVLTTTLAVLIVPVLTMPVAASSSWLHGFITGLLASLRASGIPGIIAFTAVTGTAAVVLGVFPVHERKLANLSPSWLFTVSARGLTTLAAQLAGRKRPDLYEEWRTLLAGESGHDRITGREVKKALGFVASAPQCRCRDAADAAWIPVEAILKSRKLSNLLVFGPTWAAALCILRHLGTLGVLTSAESISAIGGGLYGLVRVGRWWRDVKPPEPKARRAKEQ